MFRNARFTILVIAGTVANIAYAVTIYLSTMYLQQVRDLDPLTAGLVFLARRRAPHWAERCPDDWQPAVRRCW